MVALADEERGTMDLVAQAVERNAEAVEENDTADAPRFWPRLKSATCSRNSGLENEDDLTYELLHDDVVTADHLPSQSITGAAFHIVCALLRWT